MRLIGPARSNVRGNPEEPAPARWLAAAGEGALFNLLPGQVWLCEASTLRFIDVNDAAVHGLGYSRDEILAMSIPDLVPPSDVVALRSACARVRSKSPDGGTWRIRTASGETVRGHFSWRFLESRSAILISVTDVTRFVEVDDILLRSQTLQISNSHLKEQEANLRTAQRLLNLGVWTMDMETGRLSWSDNVYDIYGVDPETFEHTFRGYLDLIHADDRDRTSRDYARFLNSSETCLSFEHRVPLAGGTIVHVRGIGERTRSNGRRILTGVVQDVTSQLESAASLEQATRLLKIAGQAAKLGGWRMELNPHKLMWAAETATLHEEPEGTAPTLQRALNYYTPKFRRKITDALWRCAREGVPFDEEMQLMTAKGNTLWVRAIGEAERDALGAIVAVQGAIQDITERVDARVQVAELSRRLSETLESISDAFFTLDESWRFSFINGQAERVLDRARTDLIGKSIWDAFPEAVGSAFQSSYTRAVETKETVQFIERFAPLDKWFEVSAYPVPGGLAVYFRDITERRRAEQAARISEERFRLVAMATNDVIWDWDLQNGTVWWNDGMRQHFGHDPVSIGVGPESWTRNIDPADKDRVLQSIHSVLEGKGNKWLGEYRFLNAEGQPRRVIDRGFVIRNAAGRAVRMLGSMMDITEQRELEGRLRQAQKLEAVGQLTGGIAHDFNNLLTVILGNSELLTEQLGERVDLRSLAETTVAAAERGAELTHRLLAFARRQSLEPKLVDFNALVGGMESLIRRTLTADIEVAIVLAKNPCIAEVDPGQLEGALLNLAINARDAMPEGGRLTIEVSRVTFGDECAQPRDDLVAGRYACIRVGDSGSGMSNDTLKRVFEPFFSTKPVGKGSGLGLSMVYGFVKQSRGHVNIQSRPGEGTEVSLYFPLSSANEPTAAPEDGNTNPSGGNEHILVVEDDQLVRRNLVAQLKKLGYRITSATHGTEALELMERIPPVDLLFTDIVMPGGINGRQLADAARERSPELKVLYTSGYPENAVVHKGRLERGVHLLCKPYRRQELAAKVREALA